MPASSVFAATHLRFDFRLTNQDLFVRIRSQRRLGTVSHKPAKLIVCRTYAHTPYAR